MDPEVTLALLRSAVREYRRAEASNDDVKMAAAADVIVETWKSLDGWLCHGGFLPRSWMADR